MVQIDNKWIPILVIAALPLAFFWPLLFTCGLGPMEDDLIQYFPGLAWLGQNLGAGHFPLWNPQVYGGYPAIGDPQSGVFYPPNWLAAAIPPCLAYPLLLIGHYWIAGFGMYRLGRQWDLERVSALTGAVAWMFCGFLLGHRTHYTMFAAVAWFSVIFYLWARVQHADRPQIPFGLAVAAQALQILAGHVQVAAFTGGAVLLYLLITSRAVRVRMVILFGLSYLLTLALAAIQLVPVWMLYGDSVRTANSFRFITENSFLPIAWPLTIAPASLGVRVPNFLYRYPYFGPWHHCEMNCFTTLAALTLAGFAVRNVRRTPHARRVIIFLLILGLLAIFLSLGRYNPVYQALFSIPIFRPFRCPARYLVWFNFAVAGLAMFGMESALRRLAQVRLRTFAIWFTIGITIAFVATLWMGWWLASRGVLDRKLPPALANLPEAIRQAVHIGNPAIFIPLLVALALVAVCRFVPARRLAPAIFILLVVEAATFAPFYDVDFRMMGKVDLYPPVARVLDRIAPDRKGFICPLTVDPYVRPLATLEPFTNLLADQASISGYGPLLNRYHRRLFGWELWPTTDRFLEFLARKDLLNRYGIRFLIADPRRGSQIETLRAFAAGPPRRDRQIIAPALAAEPDRPFSRDLPPDPGLYRLRFSARQRVPGPLRLWIRVADLADPVWTDQSLRLTTWDIGRDFQEFSWYFFVPERSMSPGRLHIVTEYGRCELRNVTLASASMDLGHLVPRGTETLGDVRLYENIAWPGPAFFASSLTSVHGGDATATGRMRAVDQVLFSDPPARTVVIAGSEPVPDEPDRGRILSVAQTVNSVRVRVEVRLRPALLVFPAGYDPGWQASIDNRQTELLCADAISRAVLVPPGDHEVSLTYLPNRLIAGAAVTAFAGLVLVTVITHGLVARRSPVPRLPLP